MVWVRGSAWKEKRTRLHASRDQGGGETETNMEAMDKTDKKDQTAVLP